MYSRGGKRLIWQVVAGREMSAASHIALGIGTVKGASLDGSTTPTTHNRYHSPYIVDEVLVSNSSVLSGASEDIMVFSGQAAAGKRYMANNLALVKRRSIAGTRSQKIIVSTATSGWSTAVANTTYPKFTDEGNLSIAKNATATYLQDVSLVEYYGDDIIAFPIIIDGALIANIVNTAITFTINYKNAAGTPLTATYTGTIVNNGGTYKFSGDEDRNGITALGTTTQPNPLLFQFRLKDMTGWSGLSTNLRNVTGISIYTTNGAASYTLVFGSVMVTPDSDSDASRVNVAFRKLATTLVKADSTSYLNLEYRLGGSL